MQQVILMVHVLAAVALIVLVLVQHGKGAQIGAAFGSGASQTVFGSQGSGSFLLKFTGGLAAIFFITSLTLGYMATENMKQAQSADRVLTTTITPVSQSSNQPSQSGDDSTPSQTDGGAAAVQQLNQSAEPSSASNKASTVSPDSNVTSAVQQLNQNSAGNNSGTQGAQANTGVSDSSSGGSTENK